MTTKIETQINKRKMDEEKLLYLFEINKSEDDKTSINENRITIEQMIRDYRKKFSKDINYTDILPLTIEYLILN